MDVRTNTSRQLVLDDRPVAHGVFIAAAILGYCLVPLYALAQGNTLGAAALGLFGLAIYEVFSNSVQRTIIVFDRNTGTCAIGTRSFDGKSHVVHPLSEVGAAVVEQSDQSAETHRLALLLTTGMDQGIHPVTDNYSAGPTVHETAQVINRWLHGGTRQPARM